MSTSAKLNTNASIARNDIFSKANRENAQNQVVAEIALKSARATAKKNNPFSNSLITATIYRQKKVTATGVIDLAMCVAFANNVNEVTVLQLVSFIEQELEVNGLHSTKSNYDRVKEHLKSDSKKHSMYSFCNKTHTVTNVKSVVLKQCRSNKSFKTLINKVIAQVINKELNNFK